MTPVTEERGQATAVLAPPVAGHPSQAQSNRGDGRAAGRSRARAWPLAVAALALFACLVRWPYLDVPITADEGGYATAAYWWARGDTLYREITITRPQGIFVVYRLIEALGLGSVRGIHLFAAAYNALSTLLLLAVVARVWGRAVGLGAAALYALLMATPWVEGYQANAELFMTLPLLAGLYLLVRAGERPLVGRRARCLMAGCGALAALALLVKPSGIALLALAALWLPWLGWRRGERWGAVARAAGALLGGFLLGLAPAVLHGLATAPEWYLYAVLFYRLRADSALGGGAGYIVVNSLYVAGHLAPIVLLACVGLLARREAAEGRRGGSDDRRALLRLWAATAIGGMALGGGWFLHYYQQLLPPVAVAAALGARALLRRAPNLGWMVLQVLVVVGGLLFAVLLAPTFAGPADHTKLPEYEPGITAAAPVAAYLRERTAPGDTIYVAYDHADYYYLAQRRPAARWLHFRELQRVPGAFAEQVARLANPATAPCYIVGAQAFDRFGFDRDGALRAVVARDYALETTIAGVPLYRARHQACRTG